MPIDCHRGGGIDAAVDHGLKNFAGSRAGNFAGLDFLDQVGQRGAATGNCVDGDRLLLERSQHVLRDPLAAALASPRSLGDVQKVIDDRPALVHEHVGIVGRERVLRFQPRAQRGRQFAERRRESRRLRRLSTVTGTRSGSGK